MRFNQPATLCTGTTAAPIHHALSLRVADTTWSRFRGLMCCAPLESEPQPQALLITRCPSVHGFFMRYAVDVIYLGRTGTGTGRDEARYTVTHTACLKPWRVSFGRSRVTVTAQGRQVERSAHALELPEGSIGRLQIQAGDELRLHR